MPPHAAPVSRRSSAAVVPIRSARRRRGYSVEITAQPFVGTNEIPKRTFASPGAARTVHSTRATFPPRSSHTRRTPSASGSWRKRAACTGVTFAATQKSSGRVKLRANRSAPPSGAANSTPFAARNPVTRPFAASISTDTDELRTATVPPSRQRPHAAIKRKAVFLMPPFYQNATSRATHRKDISEQCKKLTGQV